MTSNLGRPLPWHIMSACDIVKRHGVELQSGFTRSSDMIYRYKMSSARIGFMLEFQNERISENYELYSISFVKQLLKATF